MTMRKMLRLQHQSIKIEHDEIAQMHKTIASKVKKINAFQHGVDTITDLLTLHGFTPGCGYNRILHECAVRTASLL